MPWKMRLQKKLTIHNLNESQSSSATDDSSSINAEDGRIDAASGELLETGTQTEDNILEYNKIIQNKIKESQQSLLSLLKMLRKMLPWY